MVAQSQTQGTADFPRVISNSGRRWALGFSLIVMLLTTIPYLLADQFTPPGWRFTGFLFAVEDGNSYIAKMLSGMAGALLFRSPYSAYPQSGVLAFLPYLLLGKLAAPPAAHEQLVAIFHIFRISAGCLALLATYDFLAYYIKEEYLRRYGLALVALGGGLGWLLVVFGWSTWLGSLPLDFISPESFGFLALYGFPHLAMARAALFWGLLAYLKAVQPGAEPGPQAVFLTGGCWLLAALFQPLAALVMGAVIAAHCLVLGVRNLWLSRRAIIPDWIAWRRTLRFAMLCALIPAPFLLYNAIAFSQDPYLVAWTAQNLILSPPLPHYLLAYGLLLPFMWVGGRNLLRRQAHSGWLLVAWVCAAPFLAYAPVNLQRRLVEGVWVAMIALACSSVRGTGKDGVSWRSFLIISAFVFPSTLFLLVGGVSTSLNADTPVFRSAQETAVLEQLAARAAPGSVVLASYATANALPAWAPLRVLAGHGPESVNLSSVQPRVENFYRDGATDAERQALIDEFRVAYVFYGPRERALGSWQPAQAAYLQLFAEQGEYAVYQVVH